MMENKGNVIQEQSKKVMVSYGFGRASKQFVVQGFNGFGFFFYVAEVGLNIWLVGLGFIIFALWNAVNDPLLGYITNRQYKFNKKWGKWFPWTMMGGIPWIISYILIFTPPDVDPVSGAWIIFGWLVFSTCLFDTFASIFDINFLSIAPNKFLTLKERRKAAGLSVPVGMVGTLLGGAIPPLFITYGVPQTYVIQGGVVVIGALILLALAIPGLREDKELIERVLKRDEAKGEEESFMSIFKTAMRQRSFVAYLLTFMFFTGLTLSISASLPFLVRYSLKMEAAVQAYLSLGFLLGGIASLFFWIKLANKMNDNKKVMGIAGILLTIVAPMFFFVQSFPAIIIVFILFGIGAGGFWVMTTPNLSDVIDEAVVKTGKHDEGVYLGIRQFFSRFAIVLQTLNFVIIQSLFGFQEGTDVQSASAITGIHISLGLIPAMFMLVGILIWWKWYDLTPEKIEIHKAKLKEMKL